MININNLLSIFISSKWFPLTEKHFSSPETHERDAANKYALSVVRHWYITLSNAYLEP